MKYILPIFALLLFISCSTEEKKKETPTEDVPLKERPIPPNPNVSKTNIVGGAHYICPQEHEEGNSAAAGTCPKCQSTLLHNQGYHQAQNNANQPNNGTAAQPNAPATTNNGPNANGQYHYTCTNGCAGGAGSAGNCATCGSTLAHNSAYHS